MSFRAYRFSLLFNYFCHGFVVTINAMQRGPRLVLGLQGNGRGTLSDAGPREVQATPKGKRSGPEAGAGGGVGLPLAFGGRRAYPGTTPARAGAVGAEGSRSSVG